MTRDDTDTSKLLEGLKKIVHAEMAMMPAPDFERYTFIFHFAPDISMGDGMEHLNSTQIIVRGSLSSSLDEALETAAHEFFHLWNVKRLRPAELGPFDYTREVYTPSLWFAEGVTTYVSYLSLLRSGLWTRQKFLGRLCDEISALEEEPGRTLMSAESSSFHAWFYDRSPQMQETNFANSTISYYNKGALLGMLLDLEMLSRTQGAKSLLDVLSSLYHKFYETPPATYYGPGHALQRARHPRSIERSCGERLHALLRKLRSRDRAASIRHGAGWGRTRFADPCSRRRAAEYRHNRRTGQPRRQGLRRPSGWGRRPRRARSR